MNDNERPQAGLTRHVGPQLQDAAIQFRQQDGEHAMPAGHSSVADYRQLPGRRSATTGTTWTRAQLRSRIRSSGAHIAPPETGLAAEPEATPVAHPTGRTVNGPGNQPARERQATHSGQPASAAQSLGVEQHASTARSVDCPCTALAGAACTPSGDHLARYLYAERVGALTRQDLENVIEELDVIAPHVLISVAEAAKAQPAAGAGPASPAQPEAGRAQAQASVSAQPDREAG